MISTAARAVRQLSAASCRPPGGALRARPNVPDGASCSRWMTCSCCSRNTSRIEPFFSPNSRSSAAGGPSTDSTLSSGTLRIRSAGHNGYDETAIVKDTVNGFSMGKVKVNFAGGEDGEDGVLSGCKDDRSVSRLPLPPRLPYSPTSHPFQRHLQILSLSTVSSTPDESWAVYLALHNSLRRYIPDDQYLSLITHQLAESHPQTRWFRLYSLMKFGQACGMDLQSLGADGLQNIANAGFQAALTDEENPRSARDMWAMIKAVWEMMVALRKQDLRMVPMEIRGNWLRYHSVRLQQERLFKSPDKGKLATTPSVVIRGLVDARGTAGLEDLMGSLLAQSIPLGRREVILAAETAIQCWEQGVDIPDRYAQQLLQNLGPDLDLNLEGISSEVRRRLDKLRVRTPTEHVDHLISKRSPKGKTLAGISLKQLGHSQPDYGLVMKVCRYLREVQYTDLDGVLVTTAGGLASASPEIIRGFATEFISASTHPVFLRTVFHALMSLPVDPETYALTRKAYAASRASEPPYRWTKHNVQLWRKSFMQAIRSRHLHFASRLYSDLLADGVEPGEPYMLALVTAVGSAKNASRPILLERFIRDFVDFFPDARAELAGAVVAGLTSHQDADDALLALNLARRLAPLSSASVTRIVSVLALAPSRVYRAAMLGLLRHASDSMDTESLSSLYATAMSSLIIHSRPDPASPDALTQDQALSLALQLSQQLGDANLALPSQAISVLIRGLLDSGRLHNALALFHAAIRARYRLKSGTVGRLMVHLVQANRLDEADVVEAAWRDSVTGAQGVHDKGVIGARVLLDVVRGKEVDLRQVEKSTGWKATGPFETFLRTKAARASDEIGSHFRRAEERVGMVDGVAEGLHGAEEPCSAARYSPEQGLEMLAQDVRARLAEQVRRNIEDEEGAEYDRVKFAHH